MIYWLQWLSMGGYAFYVWSAYGLVTFVLVGNFMLLRAQRRRLYKQLRNGFSREAL